ncbi:MAG: polysaccharide ABC transporter ATP-binding protein [Bacteroidales bacterium]
MSTVIKVEGVSKLYRLGEVGTGTLSHDLKRWWYKVRGKEDPYLKIGQVNDRTQRAEKGEMVWALRDISFEVKEGEVLGIIGRNGAGKSTLLKILSRITSPTEGVVKIKGRIASLLEVGTGFHPEMTGRENIYMNGTIMGMRRAEIDRRLDEIVEFAGIAKYLDTPVKRYSSGMTVRLGFAVAAHLNAEILLVDEVLAVGDAEFQKKALGKMQEVSHDQGRTVLFVSHNMGAVANLCNECILLNCGNLIIKDNTAKVIHNYLFDTINKNQVWISSTSKETLHFERIELVEVNNNLDEPYLILRLVTKGNKIEKKCFFAFDINDCENIPIFQSIPNFFISKPNGTYHVKILLPHLIPGDYFISAWMGPHNTETYDFVKNVLTFSIEKGPLKNRTFPYTRDHGNLITFSNIIEL